MPAPLVEAAVFELLPFDDMPQLHRFSEVIAAVFLPMSQRWPDTALPGDAGPYNQYTDALVQATLAAWSEGGLAAIGQLPAHVPVPAEAQPYDTDTVEALGEAVLKLREDLLYGFTVLHGPSISEPMLQRALDLADVLSRSHVEEVPQLAAWVLESRGTTPVDLLDIEAIWEADDEEAALREWASKEPEPLDIRVDSRAEELAEEYGGSAQVSRLRQMTKGFSPFVHQLLEDDPTPCLAAVLAFAPAHVRFAVQAVAEGPQEYLAPRVSRYGYAPQVADIAALLRCSPSIPAAADIVSLEHAEELDCPELAGWYRLDWGTSL